MKIESVLMAPPKKKSPGLDGFTAEFLQMLQELFSVHFKLFIIIERRLIQNVSCESNITLIPKPEKDTNKKEVWISISDQHRSLAKDHQQSNSCYIQQYILKAIHLYQVEFSMCGMFHLVCLECIDASIYTINVIQH